MISPTGKNTRGGPPSICASRFCDASAYSRRMRVHIGRLAADVLAFGIAPHIIQGCTKCLAICKRDTLVVVVVARRRRRRRHSCMPRPCGRASLSPNETNAPFQQTLFLNKNSLSHSCKWYAQPLPSSPFFTFQNRVCIPLWKLESIHSNPEIIHRVSNKQSWIFGRNFFFFSIDRLHFFRNKRLKVMVKYKCVSMKSFDQL